MSVVATIQKLEDGPRNCVFHLSATLGSADAESAIKKVDVTTLSPLFVGGQACTHLALERISFSTIAFHVQLLWDASTDVLFQSIPANFSDTIDYRRAGSPIQNNAGAGKTGNVMLTAGTDLTLAGSYDITLWFRKKYE